MTKETVIVPLQDLYAFVRRAFVGLGLSAEEAELCADGLVQSELRGMAFQMQGVNRLRVYADRIRGGLVTAQAPFEIVKDGAALALVDAHNGLGYAAATRAMRLAVSKAKLNGIGAVFVRHSTHFGGAAVHARRAVDGGCIGISMSNAGPEMAPWGGITPILGTNPWAIAIPGDTPFPIVLDMAVTTSGKGTMMWLARQGLPMPIDYAITKDGENTTDPNAAMDGTLLPIGGPKGYGLSFMTDVMTGVMTGAAFGSALYKNPKAQDVGHLLMAIDVEWFMPRDEYNARLNAFVSEVQGSALRPGVERIYMPGEIEHLREQKKRAEGVPLQRADYEDLKKLASEIPVEFGLEDNLA